MEACPGWGPEAAFPEMGWEPKLPAAAQAASFGVGAGGQAKSLCLLKIPGLQKL